ncbi:alpha/beta fold hydrolase [Sphingomonas sp. LHG3406-1]|uniref:alpha/beta fold hydrolase n=1 Tax=Sphingomonas sp. LHG3406-1 TaxID=2804617 RepID=UPI0026051206|nr:alpha/beta fold hydrolase [Sphingomonas sp. LHG3406-1]
MPAQQDLARPPPGALHDRAVARALDLIHAHYAEPLSITALAREAGVSRSVLCERFAAATGMPPIRYAGRWRLEVAARLLSGEKLSLAEIAWRTGFGSEAAFNRAFKRQFGAPPAKWRRSAMRRDEGPDLPPQQLHSCRARDGTRIAWADAGAGFPLLKTANWLNHLTFDWESPLWRHWLKELTRDNRLIRYDERGNGLSEWNSELGFEAFVDDLEAVVDAAGLERFDLFAISQGAAVAIAYSLRHPGRIRRLVLLGGYALGFRGRLAGDDLARREAMITLCRTGWGANNPAYRQLFTSLYIPGGTREQADWFNEMQRASTSPENAERLQHVFGGIDVRHMLPQVSVPTLVMHARDDAVIPFQNGEYLAAKIPGATLVPIDSANHILLEDEPGWQQFVTALRAFLGDQPLGR